MISKVFIQGLYKKPARDFRGAHIYQSTHLAVDEGFGEADDS